jgi:DNA modification methylase
MGGTTASLIHADPPYGMNKGFDNDNLHDGNLDQFHMSWWEAFRPHIDDNASAYIWGNSADLSRLWHTGGLNDSERLTLRNEIVWDKGGGGMAVKTEAGRMFQSSERCLFFMLGEQGFNNNADNYWEGWEGIRSALAADVEKMGWTADDIHRITGVGMFGHWFTKSQWEFIPEHHYNALQAAAKDDAFKRDHDAFKRDHDDLKRDHDDLKRDHDDLKREFYATRAYFDNSHEAMTDVWLYAPIGDVWKFPRVKGADRHDHATPKPVLMIIRAVKSSCESGGLIVDPFSGTGTTLMASEYADRSCYAMEIEPRYCDVAIKRWEDYTGQKAVKV